MTAFLNYEQQGHVVTLTMCQPERRNPLTGNTAVAEILAACEKIAADSSVRAVILTRDTAGTRVAPDAITGFSRRAAATTSSRCPTSRE